eukprot:1161378-Pelagomonas_calceolata.AAC.9
MTQATLEERSAAATALPAGWGHGYASEHEGALRWCGVSVQGARTTVIQGLWFGTKVVMVRCECAGCTHYSDSRNMVWDKGCDGAAVMVRCECAGCMHYSDPRIVVWDKGCDGAVWMCRGARTIVIQGLWFGTKAVMVRCECAGCAHYSDPRIVVWDKGWCAHYSDPRTVVWDKGCDSAV